eukprot:1148955-Pelagomonas_calceolata.AAC.2
MQKAPLRLNARCADAAVKKCREMLESSWPVLATTISCEHVYQHNLLNARRPTQAGESKAAWQQQEQKR